MGVGPYKQPGNRLCADGSDPIWIALIAYVVIGKRENLNTAEIEAGQGTAYACSVSELFAINVRVRQIGEAMQRSTVRQSGFTLIELMVTTVIIGIISSMAVPHFQVAYERLKLRSAMRDMSSTLRLARSTAISTKEQYGVYFNSADRTVTLFKDKADLTSYIYTTADSVLRVDTLPRQMVWLDTDCDNDVITFRPNGSAGFTGNGNIWSLGYTPKVIGTSTTSVLASTGRVAMQVWMY